MKSSAGQNKNSLQWNRKINRLKTQSLDYLDHPDNFEATEDILTSWSDRAKGKIYRL
jgi:hypothetical protein